MHPRQNRGLAAKCSPGRNCTSASSTATSSTSSSASSVARTSTTSSVPSVSPVVVAATSSSSSNAGTIAGSVVGGVVFLVLVVLGTVLYLRARKRRRTAPSSEFINALKAGATPVLRLDSGAEYTTTLAEKGGVYTHYSPPVPSHSASPPMERFPDEIMVTDVSSRRPSVETPLHPQRLSSQHQPSASVGSRRELWGFEAEGSPVHQSPIRADSVLEFAPRISLNDPRAYPSQSPTSLYPLRRVESTGYV